MYLKNCSECNKPPKGLECIPPNEPSFYYYVCSGCGKASRKMDKGDDDAWKLLAGDWNYIN